MTTNMKLKGLLLGFSLMTVTYMTAQTSPATSPDIETLNQKIVTNPNDTEALVGLATAYQNANDWNSAIATWNKITAILPDWAPAYYSIGYAQQSAKNNAGAKQAYEQYITKVKPEEVDASKQNLAYAYFFIAFQDKDTDKEKAKEYIAKSLQYDGSNQDALNLSKSLMN